MELCSVKNNYIDFVSLALIVLWMYAAASKLADVQLFAEQLKLQPLPSWSAPVLVWLLPAVEIITALLLAFRRTRGIGFFISLLLLLSFSFYTAFALSGAYGSIPCSCGGVFSFMGWKGHLIFNVIASVVAFSGWYLNRKEIDLTVNHTRKYYVHNRKQAENLQQSKQ